MSICRICLCSKPRKDIAEIYTLENGERQAYKDIIMFCLGIQIKEDSVLSTKLCVKCCRKIVQFYHFKVLALSNNKQMRSSELKNGVFWFKENVKIEKESENNNTDLDECLIPQIKDESEIFDFDIRADDDDNTVEINYELKLEDHSDDEFLSVIKNLKKESVGEVKEDDTENMAPIRKKRKTTKVKIPKDLISKKKKNKGVYEGVCEHCGKVFKDLRQHVRVQHLQNKRKVNCEHCDKVFSNTVLKRRHVQRTHFAVKQKCHLCGRSVADLKMHIKCIHEKDSLRFKCVHCDFKFLSQGRLNAHMSVHTKDRPFKCDICNSSFRQKIGLDNHRRQIHYKEKSHLCQFCSKSFFKKHHLTIHLRSHTNEKPYPCPECGKFYQTTTSLRNHRLIHTADKRINCTLCDASFISKNYLSNHMLSHTKEKRYPCKYCHVKFHRSDHRKRHEYTAHLKFMGEVEHVPPSYTPKKRSTNAVTPRAKLFEDDSTASSVIALDAVDCETNSVVAVSKSLA